MNKVVAVVTTFNRKKLLRECIEALLQQSYENLDVLVVNNASTDGTEDYINSLSDPRIVYYNTGENIGGAGGFSFGLKKAIESGYDYAWLMDDDSIADKNSLAVLMKAADDIQGKFSFMATTVYWTDGTQFPMNTTKPETGFHLHIDELRKWGLIGINTCSFVGCFVNLVYAEQVGLPIKEYFIYGDDVEYTTRLRKKERAFWAIDSCITHKAPSKAGSDVVHAPADRIERFAIQTRNGIHHCKLYGGMGKYIRLLCRRMRHSLMHSPDHKLKRVFVILKGIKDGIFFSPEIEYAKRPVK